VALGEIRLLMPEISAMQLDFSITVATLVFRRSCLSVRRRTVANFHNWASSLLAQFLPVTKSQSTTTKATGKMLITIADVERMLV
jgi:hypothetical protein